MDNEYLSDIQRYNHLLASRNLCLKNDRPDPSFFEIVDARMSEYAARIHAARKRFVEELEPVVSEYYRILCDGAEKVSVSYRSDLDKGPLVDILASSRDRDMALRYTSAGVQRDDFIFSMDDYPIRKCGSQGQQKSFLVSLKFAQYEIMKRGYGFSPILLLDDLFDKLDMKRVGNLLQMVAGSDFGQIFITDSNKVRIKGLLDGITSEKACFETKGGVFTGSDE